MAIYFLAHVLIRTSLSGSADLDEAEQLFVTQNLALGYGPQPPLYTWLQRGVFLLTGPSIFGLALLKNVLLFCSYSLAYLTARMVSGRHVSAVAAALSLMLLPQIAWESQRDLTHSVLASTIALATFGAFLRACRSGKWQWFLLLGAAIGGGVLSKYNYALWAAGLLAAGVALPYYRSRTLRVPLAGGLLLGVLIATPHLLWALGHRSQTLAASAKLGTATSPDQLAFTRVISGLSDMTQAVGAFILPFVAIYGLLYFVFRRRDTSLGDVITSEARLTGVSLLLIISCICAAVVLFGATEFKDRWFQPVLIGIPVVAAPMLVSGICPAGVKWLQRLALSVMILVLVMIPGKVLLAGKTGREEHLNYPYPQIAAQIKPWVDRDTTLVADTQLLAGNLRLAFPANPVVLAGTETPPGARWIAFWDARRRVKPPRAMRNWPEVAGQTGRTLEAPWRNREGALFRIGVLIHPTPSSQEPQG